jgi:hypothetical protein
VTDAGPTRQRKDQNQYPLSCRDDEVLSMLKFVVPLARAAGLTSAAQTAG